MTISLRHALKNILVGICLLASWHVPASGQRRLAPLPVEEALSWREIGNRPRLSPDGQWIAFSISNLTAQGLYDDDAIVSRAGGPRDAKLMTAWIANAQTGESRPLMEGASNSWSPVWSPDGKFLAFLSDSGGKSRLWVYEKEMARTRPVSDAILPFSGNTTLALFLSWDVLQWTPDSKRILSRVLPEGMSTEEFNSYVRRSVSTEPVKPLFEGSTVTVYRSSVIAASASGSLRDPRQKMYLGDLGLIDVMTGKLERVARKVHASRYDLSPDGAHVAYLEAKGGHLNESKWLYDVVIVSLQSGRAHVVATNVSQYVIGMYMKWSPDSRQLAYIDGKRENSHCYVVLVGDQRPRKVIDVPDTAYVWEQSLPVWDSSSQVMYSIGGDTLRKVGSSDELPVEVVKLPGKTILDVVAPHEKKGQFWSPDKGKSAYLRVLDNETKREAFYKVNLETRQYSEISGDGEHNRHNLALLEASLTRQSVIYLYEDAQHPTDLWIAEPEPKKTRQLTHANPVFEKHVLGETRLIEWLSGDGIKRQGAVLLPAGYEAGKRYPLVVWVYGSSKLSNSINRFGFVGYRNNMHLLATRGYAVLLPDSSVNVGTPMLDIAKNVLPGIDKLIEIGIADPDRLGVMGHSYGGYSTLALIVQTTRFKAAVCYAGISNLVSYYSWMSKSGAGQSVKWAEDSQGSMGGSPWMYRERYIENSPIFYLDRIQTPLLLIHGQLDDVPAAQAEEVFIGLRRLGKEVEYAKYAGEGHSIRFYPNLVDYWKRVIKWFDNKLKIPSASRVSSSTLEGDDVKNRERSKPLKQEGYAKFDLFQPSPARKQTVAGSQNVPK